MSLGDDTPDALVEALIVLLASRIDRAYSTAWGESAIAKSIPYPVIRTNLGNEDLPLLSVVRRGSAYYQEGKRAHLRTSITVEWYTRQASSEVALEYWQALAPVGVEIVQALDGIGYVDNAPVNVLTPAGVTGIVRESIKFASNYVNNAVDGAVFPFVAVTFDVIHTPDCLPIHEWDDLPALTQLYAKWRPNVLLEEMQPLVSTLTPETLD